MRESICVRQNLGAPRKPWEKPNAKRCAEQCAECKRLDIATDQAQPKEATPSNS